MEDKSSLRVLPYEALTNSALIPTLRQEVITAQGNDIAIGHI